MEEEGEKERGRKEHHASELKEGGIGRGLMVVFSVLGSACALKPQSRVLRTGGAHLADPSAASA